MAGNDVDAGVEPRIVNRYPKVDEFRDTTPRRLVERRGIDGLADTFDNAGDVGKRDRRSVIDLPIPFWSARSATCESTIA